MILLHYSSAPLTKVTGPLPTARIRTDKPRGLWVCAGHGTDDGWAKWMEYNMGEWLDEVTHVTEVKLDMCDILLVETEDAIYDLTRRYGVRDRYGGGLSPDWSAIAIDYSGIIITPYQWGCRFSPNWYYTWDVASGCIWNPEVVRALIPRPDLLPKKELQ